MTSRHVVATVIDRRSMPFEFAVAAEVFGGERPYLDVEWYDWRLCAASDEPIDTGLGFTIHTPYGLDAVATADTVIVAPTDRLRHSDELLEALRAAHARGARMVSLCTGAFALAAAGLLDGRRATTHWMFAGELAARYPEVDVDPAVLYVDEGDILTSAGTAASIDLCLHLVRIDHGAEIANVIARHMVVPPHRDGGQAQYVDHPIDVLPGHDLLGATLVWIEDHLTRELSVNELAARSAMSPRTFARRFAASTGTTPHQWITRQRVQLAQRLLETTDLSIERVATEAGFGTATNLRQHFQRIVHTTPTQYRSTFHCGRSA